MYLKKLATALAVAGLATAGGAAHAAATISNLDGSLSPFGGFDWSSGGSAWTSGFDIAYSHLDGSGGGPGTGICVGACNFTMSFASTASNVLDTFSNPLPIVNSHIDSAMNGGGGAVQGVNYQYTTMASVTETLVGCTVTTCEFLVTGGTFNIYYNTTVATFAASGAPNPNTGTGFNTGVNIISGSVNAKALPDEFNIAFGATPTFGVSGIVTSTNSTYINPALIDSAFNSTLQFGGSCTINPNCVTTGNYPWSVAGFNAPNSGGDYFFQADGNQTFTSETPEPGALALAGVALAGLAFASRRRKAS